MSWSRGLASRIPVRTFKRPSKLPVLISFKENQPQKPAQLQSSNRKNALSIAPPKPTSTFLASRAKKNLPSQRARPPASNTVTDNKSHLKHAETKSIAIENVFSKSQQNPHKAVSNPTSGRLFISSYNLRLKDQGYSKAICKDSEWQVKTKCSDIAVQHRKKPLSKEILPENRRLTGAISRNQNVNLAIVKNNVVDRRLTGYSRKNNNQMSTNSQTNNGNGNFKSVDSTGTKRNNNFGVHVRKQSFQPERFRIQNKQKTHEEPFPSDSTPKMFSINLPEVGVNNKTEFSSNLFSDGFANVRDSDEKENGEYHFLQPGVEFVPDEKSRNQILFGHGISPNAKPKQFKSSIVDRPSFFLRSRTALKNLEKLEEDGRRASMLRMTGLKPPKSDPIQAVLKALENVDLAAEDRRVSAMKKNNPCYGSPRMQRSPMFKQHVDPYKTALKRIEALQMKMKAKSTRKVTFNLESSVSNIKASEQNEKPNCKKSLTFSKEEIQDDVFKEKTEPCSIPTPKPKETTPELHLPANSSYTADKLERNLTQSHYYNMLLRVCDKICSPDKKKHQSTDRPETSDKSSIPDNKVPSSINRVIKISESTGTKASRSTKPAPEETLTSLYLQRSQPIQNRQSCVQTISSTTSKAPSTPVLKSGVRISESVGPFLRTLSNQLAEPAREDNRYSLYLPRRRQIEPAQGDARYSLYLSRQPLPNFEEQNPRRSTLSKLCTPRPISLFPKPSNEDSISPEFLCRRTSQIVAHAPISTPMVLRTMAANLEDSLPSPPRIESPSRLDEEDGQVRQRLDFDEEVEEKAVCETARVSSIGSPFKFIKLPIQGILTHQQILDNMADEECRAISSFTWLPGTAERNFWNPVAHILTHGDDMHFVPLKLK